MDTPSKRLKNQATAAKRTASSLRSLADANGIDAADRGVLLTAARIVDAMAGKTSREAKTLKAAEDKFDRTYKAALPEATKLVTALPSESTLDRLALVSMISYHGGYIAQCLNGQEPPERLQRALKMEVEDSIRDEASSIAYKAAKEGKPVSCYQEDLVGRFSRAHEKHEVVRLAMRFDAATAPAAGKP